MVDLPNEQKNKDDIIATLERLTREDGFLLARILALDHAVDAS